MERKGAPHDAENVLAFPARAPPLRAPAVGGLSKMISRGVCLGLLARIAPIDKELEDMLRMPEKMYMIERSDCFSSQSDRDISGVVMHLQFGLSMPLDFADYGIDVSGKGSSSFCTFVDRSRKVIVSMPLQTLYGGEASWDDFKDGLRHALSAAKAKEGSGERFDFVLFKDSLISTI
ncbi:MAG: hypothetical protein U0R44_04420 [Candidatus Micrarchaeia archaeon]